jgi:lipopolysaccharide export system permease protein
VIIHRYIAAEVVKPLVSIATVLVVLFVGYSSGRLLTDAVNGLLAIGDLTRLLALKVMIALEVLLPVTLYVSVILGLGRLHADHELVAIRACAMGATRPLRVVFLLALGLAVAVAALSLYGRPWAYEQSYWITARVEADLDFDKLEAGTFFEAKYRNRAIMVDAIDHESGSLANVFLRSERDTDILQIAYAPVGRYHTDPDTRRTSITLRDAVFYELRRTRMKDLHGRIGELTVHLKAPEPPAVGYKRKAAATSELLDAEDPRDRAELQWRLSTPLSTVLLALLAVLIGRGGPHAGRYGRLFMAALAYAIYYNLSGVARTWVENGTVSGWPGLWWIHALMIAILVGLFVRSRVKFRRVRAPAAAMAI